MPSESKETSSIEAVRTTPRDEERPSIGDLRHDRWRGCGIRTEIHDPPHYRETETSADPHRDVHEFILAIRMPRQAGYYEGETAHNRHYGPAPILQPPRDTHLGRREASGTPD